MTDVEQLRELIETRFDAQDKRFDAVDGRLDGLTEQVMKTNGGLNAAKVDIANLQPRVGAAERDLKHLRQRPHSAITPDIDARLTALLQRAESGSNRILRWWMLLAAIALIVGTVAVMDRLDMTKKPGERVVDSSGVVR